MKEYSVIIDTDSYAGNFEREITAYCTGRIGDCGVGDEEQSQFQKECNPNYSNENFNNVTLKADEHGCMRPCAIATGPRRKEYTSVEIFFEDEPRKEQIETIKARAEKFSKSNKINILGFRMCVTETIKSFKNI